MFGRLAFQRHPMEDPGGQPFGLAPITLADQSYFQPAFARLAQPISDYSFTNTFVWGASLKVYWRVVAEHLCVFANGTGDLTMLMPPMALPGARESNLREALEASLAIMDAYNDVHADRQRTRIEYVSDEMLERIHAVTGGALTLSATAMGGDYVYDTQRMIDLAGGALKSKRHARSRFLRLCGDCRTQPLDEQHVAACEALLEQWQHHGDTAHEGEVTCDTQMGTDILRHRETLACRAALRHFRPLGLRGMVLMTGDQLIGFTLGEALSANQASILFEKTHPDYEGAAQYIFSEFCRQVWSTMGEVNAGDDWGVPSLRFTKASYRPMRMLSKYTLTRQPTIVVAGFGPSDLPESSPRHSGEEVEVAAEPTPLRGGTVVVRGATMADVGAMLELETLCFETPEEMFNRRQLRSLIANPRATVHVLEVDGRVMGWTVGLVRQHRRSRSGRLYALAVHPAMRGRRYGATLAQACITALEQRDISNLYLEVRADNRAAIRLYTRLGFVWKRALPGYYGEQCDGWRMWRGGGVTGRRRERRQGRRHREAEPKRAPRHEEIAH